MNKTDLMTAVTSRLDEMKDALSKLDDTTALIVTSLFISWQSDHYYKIDERLRYNDKLYKVVQAHISQLGWEPDKTPALFVEVAKPGEIPEWRQPTGAQDAYMKGDQVKYDGKIWESQYDNNTWQPGIFGWIEI